MSSAEPIILAIDQGTGSTKAILVGADGQIRSAGRVSVGRTHPQPGWTEQSASELADSVHTAVRRCFDAMSDPVEVLAIGLSTQRESIVAWDRATGRPRSPVLSWQDQRTAPLCRDLVERGHDDRVRGLTGLPIDPMFSSTRIQWLLDDIDPQRDTLRRGELCVGTIDAWLLQRLTGDQLIEVGNASRTQLVELSTGRWNEELLDLFRIPRQALPEIRASTGPFGRADQLPGPAEGAPITGVLGDSHAALFAHAGWRAGSIKATYGTGTSVMGVDVQRTTVGRELCRTIAWGDDDGLVHAVEGNIRSSGDTLVWLGRLLDRTPAELAELAESASSDGVHIVPAFSGLGAPWWSSSARGLIAGLQADSAGPALARAALESIAFQVEDVAATFEPYTGTVDTLLCDGAASTNDHLMQLQADTGGRRVWRANTSDTSALGAAHLAGASVGLWSRETLEDLPRPGNTFQPTNSPAERDQRHVAWRVAVDATLALAEQQAMGAATGHRR